MPSSVVGALDAYCVEVREVRAVPGADPEPALYPALSTLLRRLVALAGHERASLVGQAHTEVGKPDFVLDEGGPLGYVEAKRPDQSLSKLRGHDRKQKQRFLDLPNLLMTNYGTFELYVEGERVDRVDIRPSSALDPNSRDGHVTSDSAEGVFRVVERFAAHQLSAPRTPRELADRLARGARILRDAVRQALESGGHGAIAALFADWRESLFADEDAAGFADAYAQTLAYGLLTARMQTSRPLSIEQAEDTLQATHPFLAAALRFLSDPQVEREIGWAADLLVRVLDPATPEVFRQSQSAPDPLLYFYEDFLARYDPALRERRGVYYTPPPVVQFQVRALQDLLVQRLGKSLGFADKGVEVLDPAAGTGTYLLAALDAGAELCRERHGQVSRGHVKRMLEQVRGFELLVGPYTVAHQRLAVRSAELAGELLPPDDVAVFLTDTLAPSHAEETKARVPLALKPLTREREAADRIKDQTPIIAILGNPPYDRSKAASGQWIEETLMRDFKDPVPREDRVHLKSLADPYVYFFRWSLWKLFEQDRKPGPRLLSFISNSSYLGGEAFQGMRKVLRERFDEIWILDLGGEQRGANPSENVFDIRVGVCVVVCFSAGAPKAEPATVRYARLEGTRAEK
ncbi:MAG: N-6 DNA methylase, partial [Actinobacteria bacterium]|nr:N-6 DNA methylase [Actinomycetota bacterium]